MVVLAIKGEDPGYEQLPLGYFERKRPETLEVTSTRDFIIDTNRGTDVIQAIIQPSDAFSTEAIIDVIENTTQSILTPRPEARLHIKASGVCGDEGHILLHVYASDNHELSDTVKVVITNQGIDCPVTHSDLIDKESGKLFYPNPASNTVRVNPTFDGETYVQLFDISGKVIFQNYLNAGYEIDVSNLRPGMYLIGFMKPDGTFIRDKLIKR